MLGDFPVLAVQLENEPPVMDARRRVSCAALCRIVDDDGRMLLGLNRNRLEQGRRIYMPLGGALEFTAPDLLQRFDATPELPDSHDLRLFMPERQLPAFRAWFLTRQERETSPFRELVEELVSEFAVLPSLALGDVEIAYVGTFEGEANSRRSSADGAWTYYLHEVFDVAVVNADVLARLLAVPLSSGLRWLARGEIARGTTHDGIAVDGGALALHR